MFEAIRQTKNCCFPLRGEEVGIRGEELWCIEHDSKSLLEELMTARTTNANFANQRSCYIKIIALVTEPKICVTSVKCFLCLSPKYPTPSINFQGNGRNFNKLIKSSVKTEGCIVFNLSSHYTVVVVYNPKETL